MTAALARRVRGRAAAATLAVMLGAGTMLLGSGSASAEPRELVCTVGGSLAAPVALSEGDQVQLMVVVPVLGTRFAVGPAQAAAPGTEVLSAPLSQSVAALLGVVNGALCRTAVQVAAVVTPAVPVPLPPALVPTLPLPPQTVTVPVPGVGVTVQQGTPAAQPPAGNPSGSQPGTPPPPLVSPGAGNGTPGFRFDPGALPTYDFSRTPFGVGNRFGSLAAPAFRFGQQVPGYAPQFGILGAESTRTDVAEAGKVQALPTGGPAAVALPVLLAVLMLSAVAGALVRTWVLRRAA